MGGLCDPILRLLPSGYLARLELLPTAVGHVFRDAVNRHLPHCIERAVPPRAPGPVARR